MGSSLETITYNYPSHKFLNYNWVWTQLLELAYPRKLLASWAFTVNWKSISTKKFYQTSDHQWLSKSIYNKKYTLEYEY